MQQNRGKMRGKTTIVINGKHYDAATGLAVENTQTPKPRPVDGFSKPAAKFANPTDHSAQSHRNTAKIARKEAPAAKVHSNQQRSQTLLRTAVKKPASKIPVTSKGREHVHVTRSPHISKFAPHPKPLAHSPKKTEPVAPPEPHPMAVKAHKPTMPTKQISSRAIKEHLLNEHLKKAPIHRDELKAPKKRGRFTSVATAGLALILLGGYLTYLNMPNLSIRVAAAQAGIDATLPEYHPDGYRFDGPVAYTHGEVNMRFSANAGPQNYSIVQKSSDWDSQAVLDNYVLDESKGDYNILSTQGLTVYTFSKKAAWVNNGMLHIVDFNNAPLSYTQVERIAASM